MASRQQCEQATQQSEQLAAAGYGQVQPLAMLLLALDALACGSLRYSTSCIIRNMHFCQAAAC